MMLLRSLRLLVAVAVLGVALAGCGDSGVPTAEPTATTTGGLFGGGGDDDPGTIPATVGDILGLSDECEAIANVFLAMVSVFSGGDPAATLASIDNLPGDLRDDATVMITAINAFAEGLEDLGVDFTDPQALAGLSPADAAELESLSAALDSPEFQEASDNLSAYGDAECDNFDPFG